MSKQVLGALSALLLCASAAQSQTFTPPAPPSPSVGNWTGVYIGGGVGVSNSRLSFPGGSGQIAISDTTAPGVSTFLDQVPLTKNLYSDGFFLSAGLRYQVSRFVFGADYDHNFGVRKSIAPHAGQRDGIGGVFTTGNFVNLGLNSFGGFESINHIRGVFGYAVSPTIMVFGSAGVAKARFSPTGVSASGMVASSPSAPLVGAATVASEPVEKYGTSLGVGMDVKVTDNAVARFEYIYDRYNVPASGGAGFGGTIGEITVNSFISGGTGPRYEINTFRGSLNYRFGPNDGSAETAKLTSKESYGKWGGFYFGGGVSYINNKMEGNGNDFLNITDTNTGQLVVSRSDNPKRSGDDHFGHLLLGYFHQPYRVVVGWEYSHTFDGEFDYKIRQFSPGTLTGVNFASNPGAAQCGIYVAGHFTCVGGTMFGAFKVTDHVRAILGYEVLPSMLVFGSAGLARGIAEYQAVSNSGIVASSPSAPLVGKATVSSPVRKIVYGFSIGAGAQIKLSDQLSMRLEYLRDAAEISISSGGVGFGGTIGNQTTNSFITPGDTVSFVNESWRGSLIYKY